MVDVLEFIFSSGKHYFGVVFLMLIISKWNLIKVVDNNQDKNLFSRFSSLSNEKNEEELLKS